MTPIVRKFLVYGLKKHKYRIMLFAMLSVIAGFLEMTGIGLVFPLIYLLVAPESIQSFPLLSLIKKVMNIDVRYVTFLLLSSITAVLILKNLYMLMFHYLQMRLIAKAKTEFSCRLMKIYLYLDYNNIISKDTSDIIKNVALAPVVFDHFIVSIFNIFVASILGFGILILLLSVLKIETLFASVVLGSVLFILHKKLKKVYTAIGVESDEIYKSRQRILTASMAGLRETKILARESFFLNQFFAVENKNYANQQYYNFVSIIPVLVIECCIIVSILSLILFYLYAHKQAHAIAVLSLLVASMFRILPHTNKMLTSLQLMNRSKAMLETIVGEISNYESKLYIPESPSLDNKLNLNHEIAFDNISFTYPQKDNPVINKISLRIKKGQFIAIFGRSGSGKSTLLDILMGLIEPAEGHVYIDEHSLKEPEINIKWKQSISYVPQNIYLLNDNLLNNIAYGIETGEIDKDRIETAIKLADLNDVIVPLKNGLYEEIGEAGLKLSAGQRQRIGIARAFYNADAELIAFDEATTNLDTITESKIINSLVKMKGKKTIVMITHNLNLLKHCDNIFVLEDGCLIEQGDYNTLIKIGTTFRTFLNIVPDAVDIFDKTPVIA